MAPAPEGKEKRGTRKHHSIRINAKKQSAKRQAYIDKQVGLQTTAIGKLNELLKSQLLKNLNGAKAAHAAIEKERTAGIIHKLAVKINNKADAPANELVRLLFSNYKDWVGFCSMRQRQVRKL